MTHLIKCDGCGRIEDCRMLGWVKCDLSLITMDTRNKVMDLCPNCWETVKQALITKKEKIE